MQLKTKWIKKRTFNKMQWGVCAFNEWCKQKIENSENVDPSIVSTDLNNLKQLDKCAFIEAMCRFIPEVVKVKDGSDYSRKTLYEMVTLSQKYLHQNSISWKLLVNSQFSDIGTVLDNVMQERALGNINQPPRQVEFIPLDIEKSLWDKGVLDEDTPDKLRETVLFLLGVNLAL